MYFSSQIEYVLNIISRRISQLVEDFFLKRGVSKLLIDPNKISVKKSLKSDRNAGQPQEKNCQGKQSKLEWLKWSNYRRNKEIAKNPFVLIQFQWLEKYSEQKFYSTYKNDKNWPNFPQCLKVAEMEVFVFFWVFLITTF